MISGVLPLRNAIKLGYPWRLALDSLAGVCDEVVVLVDPTSEDRTVEAVQAALPSHGRLLSSIWDRTNHGGHAGQSEIARQTSIAFDACSHDWVLSIQADEMLGDEAPQQVRRLVELAEQDGDTRICFEFERLYFYGGLDTVRVDWTQRIIRLAHREHWRPDPFSGGMTFVPTWPCSDADRRWAVQAAGAMFHYSRIGDPQKVALRVRNLDTFYHHPDKLLDEEEVAPYDFGETRKLDTYVRDHVTEVLPEEGLLAPFPVGRHPKAARALFE